MAKNLYLVLTNPVYITILVITGILSVKLGDQPWLLFAIGVLVLTVANWVWAEMSKTSTPLTAVLSKVPVYTRQELNDTSLVIDVTARTVSLPTTKSVRPQISHVSHQALPFKRP